MEIPLHPDSVTIRRDRRIGAGLLASLRHNRGAVFFYALAAVICGLVGIARIPANGELGLDVYAFLAIPAGVVVSAAITAVLHLRLSFTALDVTFSANGIDERIDERMVHHPWSWARYEDHKDWLVLSLGRGLAKHTLAIDKTKDRVVANKLLELFAAHHLRAGKMPPRRPITTSARSAPKVDVRDFN